MLIRKVILIGAPALVLCSILPVSAQKLMDRQLDGLKGRVMAVRIEVAHLAKDGTPDENGRWLSRLVSYDANGHKTEDETFYAFGGLSYGKHTYSYDSSGNLVVETHEINGNLQDYVQVQCQRPAFG